MIKGNNQRVIVGSSIIGLGLFTAIASCSKKEEKATLSLSVKEDHTLTAANFGIVRSGSTKSLILELYNSGSDTAEGLAESGLAAPFRFKGGAFPGAAGTCLETLGKKSACDLEIEFAPEVEAYLTSSHEDKISVQYANGTTAAAEFDVVGIGENCSTQQANIDLTNTAGTAWIAFENGSNIWAQSMTPTSAMRISSITIPMKKGLTATVDDVTLRLRANNSNNPSGTDLATATVSGTLIGTSTTSVEFKFSQPVTVSGGSPIWFLVDLGVNGVTNGDLNTYVYINGSFSDNYSGGEFRGGGDQSTTWNGALNYDMNFATKQCVDL